MRARIEGAGVTGCFHALLGISGRSGRSGRDPPFMPLFSWACEFHVPPFSSPSFYFQTGQTPSFSNENNR